MILKLNDIDVACIIGERPDERTRLQTLCVSVALTIPDRAAHTDDLADTVDYAALTERIRAALIAAQCQMIERAAKVVADVCAENPLVLAAVVSVVKRGAIAHLESAEVIYEFRR